MNEKLKQDAWIQEAFSALAEGGVASVKVEVLAKRLKVTKGSFYWHFKNRPQLLEKMLESWREGRIRTIREQVEGDRPAGQILDELLQLYLDRANPRGNAIELAVRDWARSDEAAAGAVALVDRQRLESVAGLYRQLTDSEAEAYAKAFLFYSYVFGSSLVNTSASDVVDDAELRQRCGALLVN
ncbi:TetR/AcrR family transcriptional regulator [Motiliproteus sp.]|uniref:TetR/AcrR family transcriptional regulator n=1 Tax=Motiliproteus sp. TaxID=1898955 RepID=UPI003BAD9426